MEYYRPAFGQPKLKSRGDVEDEIKLLQSGDAKDQKTVGRIIGTIGQRVWKSSSYDPTEDEYMWLQNLVFFTYMISCLFYIYSINLITICIIRFWRFWTAMDSVF